jgi:hypothetical protein
LHVLHADSTPFKHFEEFCFNLLEQNLTILRIYYKLKPLPHPKSNVPLIMQDSYFNCGTHALRIARAIAKNSTLIEQLSIHSTHTPNENLCIKEYHFPALFAKNADTDIFKQQALKLCADNNDLNAQKLNMHFAKYSDPYQYSEKFLVKYLDLVKQIFTANSQKVLIDKIKAADAYNYQVRQDNSKRLKYTINS